MVDEVRNPSPRAFLNFDFAELGISLKTSTYKSK